MALSKKHYLWCYIWWDNINNLMELKDVTHRHVHNIPPNMLRATVGNAVIQFNLLSENGGHHTEHAL